MKKKRKGPRAVIYTPDTQSEHTGSVVIQKNGRYESRMFVVLGKYNEDFLLVTDGKRRRIDKPKLKRIRHLTFVCHDSDLLNKIRSDELTDGAVRKKISETKEKFAKCISESFKEERDAER